MLSGKCRSIHFEKPPVLKCWASVAGKKESEGPLSGFFDKTSQDSYFGEKTWEQGESRMQQLAFDCLLKKAGIPLNDIGLAKPVHRFILFYAKQRHPPAWIIWSLFYHG